MQYRSASLSKHFFLFSFGCLLALLPSAIARGEEPDRWQAAMDQFAKQDENTFPQAGPILFIGSSSIRMWDLENSFGKTPTLNRGFGGSEYADITRHADRLIAPYQARSRAVLRR